MEQKQRGGKRLKAGRKPISDKKQPITIYAAESKVNSNGGKEVVMERLLEVLNNDFTGTTLTTQPNNASSVQNKPVEPVSTVTGLPPKVSLFTDFMRELDECKTFDAVEKVMKRAKGEAFLPRDRMSLESKAKQVVAEKGLYND